MSPGPVRATETPARLTLNATWHHRTKFVRQYAIALGIAIAVVLLSHVLGIQKPFLPDAKGFDSVGRMLASRWHHDGAVSGSAVSQIAQTEVWGPGALYGVSYLFVGPEWLHARLLLALGAALAAPSLSLLSEQLKWSGRTPRFIFWVAALWPATHFMSVSGLKDGFLVGLASAGLAAGVAMRTIRWRAVGIGICLVLFRFRPGLGLLVIAAILLASVLEPTRNGRPVIQGRHRGRWPLQRAQRLLLISLGGLLLLGPTQHYLGLLPTLRVAEGDPSLATRSLWSMMTSVLDLPAAVRALLGPFAWQWGPGTATPYRWLYPSAIIWAVLLPATMMGIRAIVRNRDHVGMSIALLVMGYTFLYVAVFGEGFFRQRSVIEPIALIFAGVSLDRSPRRTAVATSLWVCVLAIGALVQGRLGG